MTGRARSARERGRDADDALRTPPGLQALLLAALSIGILMLAMQLWLLTVSLDLYLGGRGEGLWILALVSGVIFLGGLLALRLLWRGASPRR